MNYPETLHFLYNSLPMYQRIGPVAFKKDLSNIRLLCKHLDNPELSFKSIHVAGTNGKGSCSHMIASVLQESGFKTGLYTSPHLKNFTERIKINGTEISKQDVVDFVDLVSQQIEEIQPSFFEITVAMAFWYFAKSSVDYAVVEVGLGGRLDSTNVIVPQVSLITNISLDHTDMLGNTIEEIAYEKAGIIKPGIPVILSESNVSYDKVFEEIANSRNSPLIKAGHRYTCDSSGAFNKKSGKRIDLVIDNLPGYQYRNIPGVLSVLDILKQEGVDIPDKAVKNGIEGFKETSHLKGRWQILQKIPLTICDTGHNIEGIKAVVKEIYNIRYNRLHVVWGMVKEKDIKGMLELMPSDAYFYFCKPDIPRGQEAGKIFEVAQSMGLNAKVIEDVNEAYREALSKAGDEDLVFIGGSTFVVAELEDL